ncbi:glycoside hydrolase family 20 zincin-like fold domain-containing protein, partial [uncultured Prevotella sp.]|uniref:glycoside hydrolase family 20 zincin-like fold domain-containing protein n=1 Tax=uncultured Prevotella sp. TaxID=159272 RepID=UPI0027E32784
MNIKILSGVVASIAMLLPAMASGQTANFNIIPQPQKVEVAQSAAPFILDQKTNISFAKGNLKHNANMLAQYIEQSTGLRPVVGKATKGGLTITLDIDKTINNAEGYTLKVDSKQIRICGATPAGVFYGIQTLRKSLPIVSGKAAKVEIP